MTTKKRKLTAREELFCQYYIADPKFNATKAAKSAGYSQKTATEIASHKLTRVHIKARIAKLMAKRSQRTEIDQDYIIRSFTAVHDLALAKGDLGNANIALQWLGKHLAMFSDKLVHDVHVVTPISAKVAELEKEMAGMNAVEQREYLALRGQT